jgi:hypothetical protein
MNAAALAFVALGFIAQSVTPPQAPVQAPVQTPAPARAGTSGRVGLALVIGNSRYNQGELASVEIDVRSMSRALASLGFKVRQVDNIEKSQGFEQELADFLRQENPSADDILLVYYSGHGTQIDGRPYLLGTGIPASADSAGAIKEYSEDLNRLIEKMEEAAPAARVLIVDACRNNAFASVPRRSGVSYRHSIEDTYLLFADEPGKTVPARTEGSAQSPFTAALLYAFENSDSGLEARFEVVRQKTKELNPDQNPQIQKSDTSANRNLPFLDHGGRSEALGSAEQLLTEAEPFYVSGSWSAFRDKVSVARVLSAEADLTARLDREVQFANLVLEAGKQAASTAPPWVETAQLWEKANALFPARLWVLERAAVAWLMADRLPEAAAVLGRLSAAQGSPLSSRATQMLVPLVRQDPKIEAVARAAAKDAPVVVGPEFEKYVKKS